MSRATAVEAALRRLRALALSYPETREDFPWGEPVVKVRQRVFLFLGRSDGGLSLTVKLPGSATFALDLPFVEPTGYGLARSGWVTARFGRRARPPLQLLERWVEESYRAVAPKRLAAAQAEAVTAAASSARKRGSPCSTSSAGSRGARAAVRRRRREAVVSSASRAFSVSPRRA